MPSTEPAAQAPHPSQFENPGLSKLWLIVVSLDDTYELFSTRACAIPWSYAATLVARSLTVLAWSDADSDALGESRPCAMTCGNSATAFSGFGDDESGFYQTYSRAFQEVWDAEREWSDSDVHDGGGEHWWGRGDAPDLGGSRDSFEMADVFYSKWSGFVSGLSFGWEDEYNLNEVSLLCSLSGADREELDPRA